MFGERFLQPPDFLDPAFFRQALADPVEGGGEPVLTGPVDAERRGIVLVHQEILLAPDLTVAVTDADVVEILSRQEECDFEPGSQFRYSNSGYAVLAMIVEVLSDLSFPDYLRSNIFDPLGMLTTVALLTMPLERMAACCSRVKVSHPPPNGLRHFVNRAMAEKYFQGDAIGQRLSTEGFAGPHRPGWPFRYWEEVFRDLFTRAADEEILRPGVDPVSFSDGSSAPGRSGSTASPMPRSCRSRAAGQGRMPTCG